MKIRATGKLGFSIFPAAFLFFMLLFVPTASADYTFNVFPLSPYQPSDWSWILNEGFSGFHLPDILVNSDGYEYYSFSTSSTHFIGRTDNNYEEWSNQSDVDDYAEVIDFTSVDSNYYFWTLSEDCDSPSNWNYYDNSDVEQTMTWVSSSTEFTVGEHSVCWNKYNSVNDTLIHYIHIGNPTWPMYMMTFTTANMYTINTSAEYYNFIDVLPYSFASTTAKSYAEDICGDSNSWVETLTTNGLCKILVFLFYPSNQFTEDIADTYEEFQDSFPFSIFYTMGDAFTGLATSSENPTDITLEVQDFNGATIGDYYIIQGSSTFSMATSTQGFSDLRDILGYVVYTIFGFAVFMRIKSVI